MPKLAAAAESRKHVGLGGWPDPLNTWFKISNLICARSVILITTKNGLLAYLANVTHTFPSSLSRIMGWISFRHYTITIQPKPSNVISE